MRASLILISRIGGKNSSQVRLATNNYMIKALATQRTDQTFDNAILAWRSRRDRPVADTHRPDPFGEDMPIGAVIVAYQVGGRRGPGGGSFGLPVCTENLTWGFPSQGAKRIISA